MFLKRKDFIAWMQISEMLGVKTMGEAIELLKGLKNLQMIKGTVN